MTTKDHTKQSPAMKAMVFLLFSLLFPLLAYGAEKTDSCEQGSRELTLSAMDEETQTVDRLAESYNKAISLYNKAMDMEDTLEKASLFKDVSEITKWLLIESNQFYLSENDKITLRETLQESLYYQANVLFKLGLTKYNFAKETEILSKKKENFFACKDLFYKSHDIFKTIGINSELSAVVTFHWASCPLFLSETCFKEIYYRFEEAQFNSVTMFNFVLDTLEEAIIYMGEFDEINSLVKKNQGNPKELENYEIKRKGFDFDLLCSFSLQCIWKLHIDDDLLISNSIISCNKLNGNVYQETSYNQTLLKTMKCLENSTNNNMLIIKFISKYFSNSCPVDYNAHHMQNFLKIMTISLNAKSISKKRTKLDTRIKIIPNSSLLLSIIQVTFCKAMKGSSFILNSLAKNCKNDQELMKELYIKRSNEYLEEVKKFYKEHIYQGEYTSNKEKESAFILARLEDLIDNPAPLAEFYRILHQERRQKNEQKIVELIKAQQKKNRRKEKEKAAQKALKESLKNQQKNNSFVPSLPEPTRTEEEIFSSSISFAKNKDDIIITSKKKTKTRGIADPSKISEPTENKKKHEEKEEPVQIYLSKEEYRVFQCLTGGSTDRTVTLENVKKLLTSKALNCQIQTGGSHPKMAAPNGGAWTIPPEWEGPISSYYRHQLNEFLQNTMGIDPETVREYQVIVSNEKKKNEKK